MTPPAFPADWSVRGETLISDGIGGRVWLADLPDGRRAVIKQPSPIAIRDGDAGRGADFLRWRDGHAAIRLIDRRGDLLLLEYAGQRTLLDHLEEHGDDDATEIAAEVVERLHAASPDPWPDFEPLRDHFTSLFRKAEADRLAGARTQFVEAAEVAERLLSGQRDVRPLHGDIHHENILLGDRGWLAIDPKGLVGDPAFDIANLFYNPVESPLRTSEARIASMAAILERMLGRGAEILLDHAFAFSALSASWHFEDGNFDEGERSLAVGRAVRSVSAQFRS